MRSAFSAALLSHATESDFVFLTGDLGFMALEPLRDALGRRFINAGIAEQNMVSVAAGLARSGLRPFVYSIAPFAFARPFEQLRNDVGLHKLPVMIVGNGGGYGYGVMGATHHAIDDYGAILTLPNFRAVVPAFATDLRPIVDDLFECQHPTYLRLGRCELPREHTAPAYAPWRRLTFGLGPTVLVVGPLAGPLLGAFAELGPEQRPPLWVLSELPRDLSAIPERFLDDVSSGAELIIVEEHVSQGSVGAALMRGLALAGRSPEAFRHFTAQGYLSGRYGSQAFHRLESGLDTNTILQAVLNSRRPHRQVPSRRIADAVSFAT